MAEETGGAGELAGHALGGYALKALLHVGPAAEVYRAEDTQLGRAVAVKVLRPEVAADPARAERFREAAQRMASLDSVGVVRVLTYGESDGRLYVAMPLLRESLRERMLRKGILPVGEAARTVIQVASGLHAAHVQGIIHGGVKPENILYDDTGRALVADFGASPTAGSPYLAPEQRRGEEPGARADVYGLGAVVYELLAGVPPAARLEFGDGEDGERVSVTIAPPSAHNPLVWPELDALALRALAEAPDQRTPDVRALALELRATVAVRLHMREAAVGTAPVTAVSAAVSVPKATFDAPGAILPSDEELAALYRPRRVGRPAMLALAGLALLLALACAGSGVAIFGGLFAPGGRGGGSSYQSPYNGALTGTATEGPSALDATPAPTDTPLPTPTPTFTPSVTPTTTPQPTATPIPAPPPHGLVLTFSPHQVYFSRPSGGRCVANTPITVHNGGSISVSWSWFGGSVPAGFSWAVNGTSGSGGYPTGVPIAPGQSELVTMRVACNQSAGMFGVTPQDSDGSTYSQIALFVP